MIALLYFCREQGSDTSHAEAATADIGMDDFADIPEASLNQGAVCRPDAGTSRISVAYESAPWLDLSAMHATAHWLWSVAAGDLQNLTRLQRVSVQMVPALQLCRAYRIAMGYLPQALAILHGVCFLTSARRGLGIGRDGSW